MYNNRERFFRFLHDEVVPATLERLTNARADLLPTLLYPHRLDLDPRRCRNIETALYTISRYIHANEREADIRESYSRLHDAINLNLREEQKIEYRSYAIRIMKRYGVTDKFINMVIGANASRQTNGENVPLLQAELAEGDRDLQRNLGDLYVELSLLDTEINAWVIAAENRNIAEQQSRCKKILLNIFKLFYLLSVLLGSVSGFLGGSEIPHSLPSSQLSQGLTYLYGMLGYLSWIFLFLSYRNSIKNVNWRSKKGVVSAICAIFTSLPPSTFAGINMKEAIKFFLGETHHRAVTIAQYVAQFSSFSANFVLNLGIIDSLVGLLTEIKKFIHGVRRPLTMALIGANLFLGAGIGLAGIVPFATYASVIPFTDVKPLANLLLSIFGNLPSAMLGAVSLLRGNVPWGVFTNPQYRFSGLLSGTILGFIASAIFFKFNERSIVPEGAPLHAFNDSILYKFIQFFSGLSNFMIYSRIGLYVQDLPYLLRAPTTPTLFPSESNPNLRSSSSPDPEFFTAPSAPLPDNST